MLSFHHCSHHWFFGLIKAMLCCYFTEMEQGCHPSAICDTLYVFPGNHQCLFMAPISYSVCTGLVWHVYLFRYGTMTTWRSCAQESALLITWVRRGVSLWSKGRDVGHWLYSDVSSLPVLDFLQRNVWQNVSVSLSQGQINNYSSLLWWNLSAPCRLEGEVWPCHKQGLGCWELQGFRQQLNKSTWRQNNKDHWVRKLE